MKQITPGRETLSSNKLLTQEEADKLTVLLDGAKPFHEKTFERHKTDLLDVKEGRKKNIRFNEDIGWRYVEILESFKHYKGSMAGQYFVLEEWQIKAVLIWAGWEKLNSQGEWIRRFRRSFWFLPKKNGKTILGSGLAIADTIVRGEAGGEVYAYATVREQAKLAWDGFDQLLSTHDEFKNYRKLAYSTILFTHNNTTFKTFGKNSDTVEGVSATFALGDERHLHRDNSVKDNISTSMSGRKQPHEMDITTAGVNIYSPCHRDYKHAKKVVDGIIEDDSLFVFIAEAPPVPKGVHKMKWYALEKVWEMANPNYGVSVDVDEFREQAKKSFTQIEYLDAFLTKKLNIWSNASSAYIQMDDWFKCQGEIDTSGDFVGTLDLSIVDDWSAYGRNYKVGDKYHLQTKYFIPEFQLEEREKRMGIVIRPWVEAGWVILTPGKTVNHDYIFHYIEKDIDSGRMEAFCYDPWKARRIIRKMHKKGYEDTIPVRQGFATLSEPTKMLSDLVLERKIVEEGNPVTALHISNLSIVTDPGDNIKPNKEDRQAKIDGAACIINGLAYYVHDDGGNVSASVYEGRGMRSL